MAILIYGPMTITPLVRAIAGYDVGFMLLVFVGNGSIFCGLLWLGIWLRHRSLNRKT